MKEKSAEKFMKELSAVENVLEEIDAKDKELYNFVEEKSEGLEPNAKQLIKTYADISRIAQREFNTKDVMDKEKLIQRAKTFKDITDQIFERLEPYLISLPEEEAENTKNFLINLAEESKAIQKDAENIDPNNREGMEFLNGDIVSVLYRLRDVTEDLYEANLYEEDSTVYNNLLNEIPKKIAEINKKQEKEN